MRVKNFGEEKCYTFERVRGFKFKQGESGEIFLKLKLHRQWFTFEVDYGQIRTLNKYLPTYLSENLND